jgi:inosose dehydratase
MSFLDRIAGAPITWGVDGSPGWGYLMDRERVLAEMHELGLRATELGPDGYLPADVAELKELLDRYELELVGGFVPAVLYRQDMADDQLAYVDRASAQLAGLDAGVMVLGPDSHHAGYDRSIELDDEEWKVFFGNLDRVIDIAGSHGLVTALHPHWGMAIERQHHVERLLEESSVPLCIDTGHLALAGADPVALTAMAPERVAHVHLKDVDPELAERVRAGDLAFREGVIEGLFRPIGSGIVDIERFIEILEASGYDGWYVLEQDAVLDGEPDAGSGPIGDARASVAVLASLQQDA